MSRPAKITRHTPLDKLPEYLSVTEFAIVAHLGRSRAYEEAHNLPHRRFGRTIRIHRSALEPEVKR